MALYDVREPSVLSYCGSSAFEKTAWLEKKREEVKGLIYLGGFPIDAKNAEGCVVLPDTLQCIPSGLFRVNTKITEVVLPKQVKEISSWTFFGCTK